MTMDFGPFLESVAPLSILTAAAFGIGRTLYKQDEHGKKLDKLLTEVESIKQAHAVLERRVLDAEMFEKGQEVERQRRRILSPTARGRSRKPRSK